MTTRITHGGRHGYLVALEGCWMTVAYDCAEVDEPDQDELEAYWSHDGRWFYTTDIRVSVVQFTGLGAGEIPAVTITTDKG